MDATVATGLSRPTAFALAPDGRIFVAEQTGNIRIIRNGQLLSTALLSLQVNTLVNRGILGLTLDPNFANNGYLYVYYTVATGTPHDRVSRFTAIGNSVSPSSELVWVYLPPPSSNAFNNNSFADDGGGLAFNGDGTLFIGVGDNNSPASAQDLNSPFGKVLRINSNGSIPPDDPHYTTGFGINRAIYAIGLHDPTQVVAQPGTTRLYINDIGLNFYEKIVQAVPVYSRFSPMTENPNNSPGFTNPVFAYQHGSGNQAGYSISGGAFYVPAVAQFGKDDFGDYFFADRINNWIRVYNPSTNTVSDFATNLDTSTPVSLQVDAAGNLFYLAQGDNGSPNTGVLHEISFSSAVNRCRRTSSSSACCIRTIWAAPAVSRKLIIGAQQVPQLGRLQVATELQHSPEAVHRRVTELYQQILGRYPDPGGLAFFSNALEMATPSNR